jgi:hypothetical protein
MSNGTMNVNELEVVGIMNEPCQVGKCMNFNSLKESGL